MKYCINYYKNFRYLDEVDEIIFPKLNENVIKYIEGMKQEQRAIISLVSAEDLDSMLPLVEKIKSIHQNYTIIISIKQYGLYFDKIKGIYPFFLGEYCKTFDQVYTFIKLGVSDVYITETLGFSLGEIGKFVKEQGIKVRVLPNVAQSTLGSLSELPHECRFFIRPEDVDVYEPYVDVFELFGNEDKLSVTYEIYKEKKWKGFINHVVKGMNDLFSLDAEMPFGEYRLNCKQRCYQCNLCTRQKEINNIMDEQGIIIKKQGET